ncbi:hypothetical protein MRB53_017811 [Persea americana]|uniref:Uncharacterized protein n=1 Tax=Persea americana TaxID=3435 RepID=A0ACC2M7I8_PERAE|nr:hypothetical protein MRB53_017811 [Persea americana]
MEGEEEACNTRLCLGIGCGGYGGSEERGHGEGKPPVRLLMLFPTHLDTSKEEEDGNRNDHGKNGTWKKLKLTKEQSSMLEDIFKERNNLTMMEKQALAKKLNLSPRQVEVWFQNRRARTKSKQMEFHRAFLKKQCERLSNENLQLKKEMQELMKLIELSSPFYSHELPKATATVLALCPSCKKIA